MSTTEDLSRLFSGYPVSLINDRDRAMIGRVLADAANLSATATRKRPLSVLSDRQQVVIDGLTGDADERTILKRIYWNPLSDLEYDYAAGVLGGGSPGQLLLTDLVSYWTLDEESDGSGAVTRIDSLGVNNLDDINTVTSTAGVSANTVNAARFTRANSETLRKLNPATLQGGDRDWSIMGWVRLLSKPGNMAIISKGAAGGNSEYLILYELVTDKFRLNVYNGLSTSVAQCLSTITPALNTWYHVAFGYKRDDVLTNAYAWLSVNAGARITDDPSATPGTSTAGFELARAATLWLDGDIDEVGFWSKFLTDPEIAWHYNNGAGRTYPFT